jgi:AraC-like DNA-binding protein
MPSSAVHTFTDPDAYQAAFRDMRAESVITKPGSFRADFTVVKLDRLSLQRAQESLPRVAYSAVNPKQLGIAFVTSSFQQIYVNGLELPPGEIIVFRAGSEGHNRSTAACQFGTIAMSHEDGAAAGQVIIGRELIAPTETHAIRPSSHFISELLSLHGAVNHPARSAPDVLIHPEVARALDEALTRVLVLCLSEGQAVEVGSAHWRHAAAMRRLEDLLEANPDRTLYSAELCSAAGVSDRTLRTLCHEHLGMSSTRYLWLRRMHLAHRALRRADAATATVTEIATNFGFWELGRFAVAHRSLFGEAPSVTLRRPPADPGAKKFTGSPWRLPESA